MQLNKTIRIAAASLIISSILLIAGCNDREPGPPPVTLTYYKLFDDSSSLAPIIDAYEDQNDHVTINYRKFNNAEEYEETIINEIAEGEGPDIFSMPTAWIQANHRKISPGPPELIPAQAFANTFVEAAYEDLVFATGNNGDPLVYGMPLTVDTLALYYNKDHFERAIPERGKPNTTWSGLTQDVLKLRRVNGNQILRAGIALGDATTASRTVDVFYALTQQYEVDFYNNDLTESNFNDNDTEEILEFITSFTDPESSYYTWDDSFVGSNETDITKFINGDISMMFGYSHLYQDIINQIRISDRNRTDTIAAGDVRIAPLPQVSNDPEDYVAYSQYFAETVSRTSRNPEEAWKFLRFLARKENVQSFYNNGGFKPTARRDQINDQRQNGIYRPFVEQLGYAKTLANPDLLKSREIFTEMFSSINNGQAIQVALNNATNQIDRIIPAEGIRPPIGRL